MNLKDQSGYGLAELLVGAILLLVFIVVLFKVLEHL